MDIASDEYHTFEPSNSLIYYSNADADGYDNDNTTLTTTTTMIKYKYKNLVQKISIF